MDGPKDFFYGVDGVGGFKALRLALGQVFSLFCENYHVKLDYERNAAGHLGHYLRSERIMIN
jgi:hypothetical protein